MKIANILEEEETCVPYLGYFQKIDTSVFLFQLYFNNVLDFLFNYLFIFVVISFSRNLSQLDTGGILSHQEVSAFYTPKKYGPLSPYISIFYALQGLELSVPHRGLGSPSIRESFQASCIFQQQKNYISHIRHYIGYYRKVLLTAVRSSPKWNISTQLLLQPSNFVLRYLEFFFIRFPRKISGRFLAILENL